MSAWANSTVRFGFTGLFRWSIFVVCFGSMTSPLMAQVLPDNTLPNNSAVTTQGNTTEITGGTVAGENLFHSFAEFSVSTGNTAFFNNANNIANIISRVTGSNISSIDGLLSANGTANLFLLNPNGIVFGENAVLNIGGSFIGSTANSMQFADGSEFNAVDPQAPPLLTVNIPVGLQYGTNAGEIRVIGSGNNLSIDPNTFAVVRQDRPSGLAVQPDRTLALVGGNVALEGGNLTAAAGNIELGSVGDRELVGLTSNELGWELNYEDVVNFQDISLSQAASIDASGRGGGSIRLQGQNIELADGSAILSNTVGDLAGGSSSLRATNQVKIRGTSAERPFFSGLFADVADGATGNGGNWTIDTPNLLVADGAQVGVNTFGDGDAGTLTVSATEVRLVGDSPLGASGFFSNVETDVTGSGGNLVIDTSLLGITDGAQIATTTFGIGNTGVININADVINLIGESDLGASGLFSNVELGATGNGGNLTIDSDLLSLSDGAQISVTTFGKGDAGALSIDAQEVEIFGGSEFAFSGLFSAVELEATGQGGSLNLETNSLLVASGGQIVASTAGEGNGGEIAINATESVELRGRSQQGRVSGLFANAIFSTGDGGNIRLSTPRLTIEDGATINASNFSSSNPNIPPGSGRAGNIAIEANSLVLDTKIDNQLSTITAATAEAGGGQINLNIQDFLSVRNGSQINADARDISDGGEITIVTDFLELITEAEISASSSGTGNASNINITSQQVESDNGQITASSDSSGGGNIFLNSDLLSLDNQSLLSTSVRESTGGGGDITISSTILTARNNSNIRADAVFGTGGNINISTQGLFLDSDSQITASSEFGVDGTVSIEITENRNNLDRLPEATSDRSQKIATGCAADRGNVFVAIGKGGIPEDPSQYLVGEMLWSDLRPLNRQVRGKIDDQDRVTQIPTTIVEAQNWIVNERGQVQLIAANPTQTKWRNSFDCLK